LNSANIEKIAAEERREYMKKWRAANKDKVSKHNREYWSRRAKKRLAKDQSNEE